MNAAGYISRLIGLSLDLDGLIYTALTVTWSADISHPHRLSIENSYPTSKHGSVEERYPAVSQRRLVCFACKQVTEKWWKKERQIICKRMRISHSFQRSEICKTQIRFFTKLCCLIVDILESLIISSFQNRTRWHWGEEISPWSWLALLKPPKRHEFGREFSTIRVLMVPKSGEKTSWYIDMVNIPLIARFFRTILSVVGPGISETSTVWHLRMIGIFKEIAKKKNKKKQVIQVLTFWSPTVGPLNGSLTVTYTSQKRSPARIARIWNDNLHPSDK